MSTSDWFDNVPVIGQLSPAETAAWLREVGDDQTASLLDEMQHAAAQRGPVASSDTMSMWDWLPFVKKPWQHTAHAFGYLAPSAPGDAPLTIVHAGAMQADKSLKNSRIKIALNRLRVADYPGGGTHQVLFDFYAQNQLPGDVEHIHFNGVFEVEEGSQAGIVNYPIFVGLNVGNEGVAFKCFTVNVKNSHDEGVLGFLRSDVFKAGLKLATVAQPAIAPLSQMAIGLTESIAKRNQNKAVQNIHMGLDFGSNRLGARLAEGDYIAVQIPMQMRVSWKWGEWVFNPEIGEIVKKDDPTHLIPYNYIGFSISRYEEPKS